MTCVYDAEEFELIAESVGVSAAAVEAVSDALEAAATWYRSDRRTPRRRAPSELARKLDVIGNHADRLLKSLGVAETSAAEDGLADRAILEALADAGPEGEDAVLHAAKRVAGLVPIIQAAKTAKSISERAGKAAKESREVGALIVPPGHAGDIPTNSWISALFPLYRQVTGREVATSVGGPAQPNEGEATGPLISFLEAAGATLDISMSSDAWRERVRLIQGSSTSHD